MTIIGTKKYDAIYSRQSIEKEDSLSIQTQIDIAKPFCTNEICYYSDPGWSGGTMNRPDLKRLIQDIKKGIINKIVVYRLDRLSRTSMAEFFTFVEFLSKHKVGFVSATEPFDTTSPMGEYMMLTLAGIARLERQNISARISDNVDARVQRGHWISGVAPYGFDNVKTVTATGQISTLKANSDIETTIYIMNTYYYNEDTSLGTIRDDLNNNNVLTARGKKWSRTLVQKRIQNPAPVCTDLNLYQYFKKQGYVITSPPEFWTGEKGCLLVKRKDGCTRVSVATWEGYIESKVWIGCLEKAKRKLRIKRRGIGDFSWLLGLCKCGYCGYCLNVTQYRTKAGKRRRYGYCAKHQEKCCQGSSSYNFDDLENMVEGQLIEIIGQCNKNPLIDNYESYVVDSQKQLKLIKLDEELENFFTVIKSGDVSKTTIKVLNQEIEVRAAEKERIQTEIEKERKKQMIIATFDFTELSFDEKKTVARAYIKEIMLFGKEKMEIKWNV